LAVRAADEFGVKVVHPIGVGLAEAGPLIGGTLRITAKINELVVETDSAGGGTAPEFHLAKAGPDFLNVHDYIIDM